MFSTKIIADSQMQFGHRCTSFLLTFPRYILAEFNTHRMLGRNSASSRAIPFEKMLKSVQETPFIPEKWMIDHAGMQGTKYAEEASATFFRKHQWLEARDAAVEKAKAMHSGIYTDKDKRLYAMDNAEMAKTLDCILYEDGEPITKQVCNRLLEPFMWHTVVCTATEYENFFALRANQAAEIHMQKLADMMLEEYNKNIPSKLSNGKWHLPFVVPEDYLEHATKQAIAVSVARSARTSYTVVGVEAKIKSLDEDQKLHDRLHEQGHMSPFEHPCSAMTDEEYQGWSKTILVSRDYIEQYVKENNFFQYHIIGENRHGEYLVKEYGWCGHLRGFIPYRKMIQGENRRDPRIISHAVIKKAYNDHTSENL